MSWITLISHDPLWFRIQPRTLKWAVSPWFKLYFNQSTQIYGSLLHSEIFFSTCLTRGGCDIFWNFRINVHENFSKLRRPKTFHPLLNFKLLQIWNWELSHTQANHLTAWQRFICIQSDDVVYKIKPKFEDNFDSTWVAWITPFFHHVILVPIKCHESRLFRMILYDSEFSHEP